MKKTFKRTAGKIALALLFIFPGLSGFPCTIKAPVDKSVVKSADSSVDFPILIGIP